MINFIEQKFGKKPFLLFLPFLLFFILFILKFQSNALQGDESRYLYFAHNLTQGFYSPPAPDINLWNGPGYALFLTPFVALKAPIILIVLMNAVFYYFSIVLLFKTIRQISSFKAAFFAALFWGCYYNSYQDMMLICTEILTAFLITLLLFFLVTAFVNTAKPSKKYLLYAGLTFGYLILTKVLFAYVMIILLGGLCILFVLNRKKLQYKRAVVIMLIAFATITPYLVYTYSLTGRLFYLGNSGGMSLYWMSTPYEGEYGDWFDDYYFTNTAADSSSAADKSGKLGNYLAIYESELKANHKEDFNEIAKYRGNSVALDDAYKRIALRNIKAKPVKYLQNCLSNTGRLFFSNPYSYTLQSNKIFLRLPMSGLVFILSLFSLVISLANWKQVIFPLQLILCFVVIYLGLSTLLSAYTRMFTIVIPMLLCWITFIVPRTVKINLKFNHTGPVGHD